MEFEFDKEIDALLRQTAKSETAFAVENSKSQISNPKSIHLDADGISAFAENALPEKTRQRYTAHFADCDRCRKVLSNTILMNSEAEIVPVSSAISPGIVAATASVAWYRRLFAFPNLAYAMGALVLLFGGFFAFTVLQNVNNLQNKDVSQISDSQSDASGPNYDGEPAFSAANSTANASNAATMTNSNMAMSNSVSSSSSNMSSNTSTNAAMRNSNASSSTTNSALMRKEAPENEAMRETSGDSVKNKNNIPLDGAASGVVAEEQKANDKNAADAPREDEKTIVTQAPSAVLSAKPSAPADKDKQDSVKAKSRKLEMPKATNRQIGGKIFALKDDVWYDSNYKGQSTTNIRRGSNEYKKLDSDLRSIADNLSGTVVVVWKSKAYRIQ